MKPLPDDRVRQKPAFDLPGPMAQDQEQRIEARLKNVFQDIGGKQPSLGRQELLGASQASGQSGGQDDSGDSPPRLFRITA